MIHNFNFLDSYLTLTTFRMWLKASRIMLAVTVG